MGEELAYEARVRRADGEFRWMFHRKAPHRDERGEIVKWFGSSIDIEEIKRTESKLKKSEAYLSEAQRLSQTGSFGWNPDTGEIVWSDEAYRIFEYDSTLKPTLDSVVQRVHPDDRVLVEQVIDRASHASSGFEHEYRLLLSDGRVKHVHAIAHALRDASGNREFIGAATDVTERKQAEEHLVKSALELQRSQFYLTEAQRLGHIGNWVFDPAGRFDYWSDELFRIYGLDPGNGPPSSEQYLAAVHPQDRESMASLMKRMLSDDLGFDVTKRIVRASGEVRYVRHGDVRRQRSCEPSSDGWPAAERPRHLTTRSSRTGRHAHSERRVESVAERRICQVFGERPTLHSDVLHHRRHGCQRSRLRAFAGRHFRRVSWRRRGPGISRLHERLQSGIWPQRWRHRADDYEIGAECAARIAL